MKLLRKGTLSLLIASFLVFQGPVSADQVVEENQLLKVPGLGLTGKAFISWFFLRQGVIWQNGRVIDLHSLSWPQWDRQQIPARLVPIAGQKTHLILFNKAGKEIGRQELKEAFSPAQYLGSEVPNTYRVELEANDGHLRIIGPAYDWIVPKKIASCEVDVGDSASSLDKNRRLTTCFDTLKAYAGDERPGKPEYYIRINWPSIKGKENIMASKAMERDLKSLSRKGKTIYLSDRHKGSSLTAEVGVTQNEKLPRIDFNVEQYQATQGSAVSPDTKTVESKFATLEGADGSKILFIARYSDGQDERSVTSPVFGGRRINLQVINSTDAELSSIAETREPERLTGVFGFLRPWQILAFGNLNFLTSSRGENNTIIGLPGVDLKYHLGFWDLQPFLTLENQIVHLGSSLSIEELKAGVSQKIHFVPGAFYSIGYNRYSLSGENRGASRLGNFDAILVGLGASQRREDWILRETAGALFGNSTSLDLRIDGGRMVKLGLGDKIYIGGYIGYSQYRAYVVNKINNRELFSESRLQIGLMAGWMGLDTY